jgi:hypothetical protein
VPYFVRLGPTTFRATEHVGGAWDTDTQHIAPALGLLVHAVEQDRDKRRDDGLVVARLSYDIMGTVPIADVDVKVTVIRAGRTIELVDAVLEHDGRAAVRLRAWLMQPGVTDAVAGSALPRMEPPESMDQWDATTVWPGGFIATAEVRRAQIEPGRAQFWVRSSTPLLDGDDVSPVANVARLMDIANGMTVRADPANVLFPNVDLTAHFLDVPQGEWIGFDTTVSFGPGGLGLTQSTLHDVRGPIGSMSQMLTVRPVVSGNV